MEHDHPDRFMRMKEVLEMLSISRSTLYLWIRKGIFPQPTLIGGSGTRAVRWRRSVIERWLETNQAIKRM